jgi:glucosyl-3-phosphoglycerate synthase
MASEIATSIFRTMASEGIKLDTGLFDTLLSAYVRKAEDTLRYYGADARINGLEFDRHLEEMAVSTLKKNIRAAASAFLQDPLGAPLIPNWNRIQSALPGFLKELDEAVRLDNE